MPIYYRLRKLTSSFIPDLLWDKKRNRRRSVYFFTFHKCASTLFSQLVLPNCIGLRNKNYASQLYVGKCEPIVFREKGYIYGPIRLSSRPPVREFHDLVEPVSRPEFITDKSAVFMVRDPRDILVSSYFSFGFSHGFSPIDEIRAIQMAERKEIQAMTLDEYAIKHVDSILEDCQNILTLAKCCREHIFLRYEDMVENYYKFIADFQSVVPLKSGVSTLIYDVSRPNQNEDPSLHRRSGKVRGFEEKLSCKTINIINGKLGDMLSNMGYKL